MKRAICLFCFAALLTGLCGCDKKYGAFTLAPFTCEVQLVNGEKICEGGCTVKNSISVQQYGAIKCTNIKSVNLRRYLEFVEKKIYNTIDDLQLKGGKGYEDAKEKGYFNEGYACR